MDVKLQQTNDGGDFDVAAGVVELTPGLDTAAYLSLYGGNPGDDGVGDNPGQWWGNLLDGEPLRSRVQHVTQSVPATAANLRRAEDAARQDLAWLLREGIVKQLTVSASIPAANRLGVRVQFDGDQSVQFLSNWQASL